MVSNIIIFGRSIN